jgi:diguanylate cyclase (GGDEF)-like protein
MNAKQFNELLIYTIALTIIAMFMHRYIPERRLSLIDNPDIVYSMWSTNNKDQKPIGYWIDEAKLIWECKVEEPLNEYKACSIYLNAASYPKGIDFSRFTHLRLELNYQGSSHRIRIFLRNSNPRYTRSDDANSSKFQQVNLHTQDLVKPISIPLQEFTVADWWINQFDIIREDAGKDFTNIVSLGVDFDHFESIGIHRVQIKNAELTGEWISAANWYLTILIFWLLGIFIYALNQLRLLRRQTSENNQRIYQLALQNSKLEQQSNEFRRLSTVDPLTQCFNRFGVHQIISRLELISGDHSSPSYSLILIDIDYFKRINDRRGHDAGDRVLQVISEIVQTRIRKEDYLGRWGGEEFIVILPNTRQEFSLALAEKLRLIIHDTVFEPDNPLSVTASFGITQQEPGEDFATTFKRVDKALYIAKNQGRNCSVLVEAQVDSQTDNEPSES